MINQLAIRALNLALKANPDIRRQFVALSMKVIQLNLPFFTVNLQILPTGYFEAETALADCQITFPLATAGYFIHKEQLKTFQQLKITGKKPELARTFLTLIAQLEFTNLLYQQSSSSLLGIATIQLEAALKQLLDYAKLLTRNATQSGADYLQYEAKIVSDKYSLEQFCTQVDELNERCQLLAKRIERLYQS